MLTDVHRITPRARAVLGRSASSNVTRVVAVSSPKLGHNQQTRHYHFGMWSSYLDPESHHNRRHRHGTVKPKFAEHLVKNLSWEQNPVTRDPRVVFKRIIGEHTLYEKSPCSRSSDKPSVPGGGPTRPDNGYAEAGNSSRKIPWMDMHTPLRSQFNDILYSWMNPATNNAKQATSDAPPPQSGEKAHASPDAVGQATTKGSQEDDDYVIDPITNRKVSRVLYGSSYGRPEHPVPTFKSYRSQFTPFSQSPFQPLEPEAERPVVHSHGPPPADELRKYRQVNVDPNPADASSSIKDTTTVSPGEYQTYKSQTVQSEEYSRNHLRPDETRENYHDLHKYNPYMHNEPDGYPKEEKPKYDDLHKYTPYMYNEDVPAKDDSVKYNDLDQYGPYMYKEDAKTEQSSPKYNDLDQYGPFMYQEGMRPEESPRDPELDRYGPYMYKEDMNMKDTTPKYDDLHKYSPTEFDDPTSTTSEQPFSQYGDLDQYKKFRHHDAEGELRKETPTDSRPSIAERLRKVDLSVAEPQDKGDKGGQPLKTSTSNTKATSWDHLESAMDSNRIASDVTDRQAFANVLESRARKEDEATQASETTMPGRSFWDLLARRMGNSASETEKAKDQTSYAIVGESEPSVPKLETALDRQNKSATGSRMDRRAREDSEVVDPYSKEPQGLETSYAEECDGKPTWPTFVRTYNANTNRGADAQTPPEQRAAEDAAIASVFTQASSPTSSSSEPTVYKILAYNPTTNEISTAETTSTVPPPPPHEGGEEKENPGLTPADVLPRLSNPSQFFPLFAPLQADGFEIASGSGNVLVFRKVARSLDSTTTTTTRDAKAHQQQQYPPVNPIDMMGRPAPLPSAAAFASPTGFLNYDLPTSSAAPAPVPAIEEADAEAEVIGVGKPMEEAVAKTLAVEEGEVKTTSTAPLDTLADAPIATAATAAAAATSSSTGTGTAANTESDSDSVAIKSASAINNHPLTNTNSNSESESNPTQAAPSSPNPEKEKEKEEEEEGEKEAWGEARHQEEKASRRKSFWNVVKAAVLGLGSGILLTEEAQHRILKRQREEEERKRKFRFGRGVLVAASSVVAFSYVLGVVADYFVTGGVGL